MKIDGKPADPTRAAAVMANRQARSKDATRSADTPESSKLPPVEPSKRSDTSDIKETSGIRTEEAGSETPLKGLPARKMDESMASAMAIGVGDMIRQEPQKAVRVHGLDVNRAANFL